MLKVQKLIRRQNNVVLRNEVAKNDGFCVVRFGVRAQDPLLRTEHKIRCLMSDI